MKPHYLYTSKPHIFVMNHANPLKIFRKRSEKLILFCAQMGPKQGQKKKLPAPTASTASTCLSVVNFGNASVPKVPLHLHQVNCFQEGMLEFWSLFFGRKYREKDNSTHAASNPICAQKRCPAPAALAAGSGHYFSLTPYNLTL